MVSRVELFESIRRDHRREHMSVRALARRYQVHRRVVRQALEGAMPPPRKKPARRPQRLDPVKGFIDAMLIADLSAPRKQRHTARRIWQRLAEEYAFTDASYATVCDYVSLRRPQIEAEAREGHGHLDGMVPQEREPGAEAEVDFADVWVRLAGEPVQCHLFTLRLSYSGKAVHRVFASESQEAFMQGHVEAFRVLGGLPLRHIRYDNLKPAVSRVCFGRIRVESERWVAFRSHYGFDAFYCLPGQDGAHEKGGVEHEGGRFRRAHLVPVPEVATLEELNDRLAAIDETEDARHIDNRPTSVGFDFRDEAELLAPLPADDFDYGVTLTPKVSKESRITVRMSHYSVPARFIGQRVRVSLRANELLVYDRLEVVARHPRLTRRYGYRDVLDHFLEILLVKPGALAGSTGLAAARECGAFTSTHDAFWAAARAAHGDADGTRALISVLLLHRRMPAEAVLAGITAALDAGSTSADVVAIEARKAMSARAEAGIQAPAPAAPAPPPESRSAEVGARIISLPRRAELPADTRPEPSVAVYDQLLSLRPKGSA
ncbi:IS21 family transposase [Streptomyces kebangsaanensis]|uniref:IS21 family transposase n=1 Tax=Streptomyces kebangsaanensis TaxID=864058 RepID=UPI00093AD337|nr:IS21 family transposase [Streptomyces kebangsaanensis]